MQIGHEYIRDRAYFVAGQHAGFRRLNDPAVESAIRDAENFLATLPDNVAMPLISGGTSSSKENLLVLTWLVSVDDAIEAITIIFAGHGRASARWPDRNGRLMHADQISIDELKAVNVPSLLAHYRPALRSH